MLRLSAILSVVLLAACSGEVCDAASLESALDDASSGDVVTVGACEIDAVAVRVPAGVTLEGANEVSLLRGTADAVVLELEAGSVLRGMRIESSSGLAAIRAEDAADVRIEDVFVRLDRGVGLSLTRADRAHIERFSVEGPAAIADVAPLASPEEGALGIVLRNSPDVEMAEVGLDRIGPWGYVTENSSVRWSGGSITNGVGTAILAAGGELVMENVSIENMARGLQPFPAYGLVASAAVRIESAAVTVRSVEGIGVLHDASSGVHAALIASENRFGGVWIQRSDDVALNGCTLEENGVAGLSAVRSSNIAVSDSMIARSRAELAILGVSAIEAGDGVYVSEPMGPITLARTTIADHPRIGVLADVRTGNIADISFDAVDVSGEELGCLAQDAAGLIPLGGWDEGVTRGGAVGANDAAQIDALATVGAVADSNVPELSDASLDP
jgi:hypothetical protein